MENNTRYLNLRRFFWNTCESERTLRKAEARDSLRTEGGLLWQGSSSDTPSPSVCHVGDNKSGLEVMKDVKVEEIFCTVIQYSGRWGGPTLIDDIGVKVGSNALLRSWTKREKRGRVRTVDTTTKA